MKYKHLPRLWCALQGVLPLQAYPVAPSEGASTPLPCVTADSRSSRPMKMRKRIADDRVAMNLRPRGPA